jgi:WIF domain
VFAADLAPSVGGAPRSPSTSGDSPPKCGGPVGESDFHLLYCSQPRVYIFIAGVPGDLYYVRNGQLNDYALAFNLPLKPNITELFFDWNATYSQPPVSIRQEALNYVEPSVYYSANYLPRQ